MLSSSSFSFPLGCDTGLLDQPGPDSSHPSPLSLIRPKDPSQRRAPLPVSIPMHDCCLPQEKLRELVQKRLGGQPINVTHSQGLLLHSVPYGSSSSLLPPILQCIPALTMILSLQAPLPWSPSWPAPSLLEHEQGGFLLHHLQVWQRKSPQQVRETHTHSLLLLTETTPSSAYGVCRGVVGLSPLHKEAAKGENSEAFSSMNSMLPLLSTWTITFDFSRALYVAQFM